MNYTTDARRHAPATLRNREPILAILAELLPPTGTVLEIASGTGEHAVYFAPRLAPRQWLPSDPSATARASIAGWGEAVPCPNLHPPLNLDVMVTPWPVETPPLVDAPDLDLHQYPITAIVSINMIHIAPWDACLGLLAGASRLLPTGGILYLYGPFKQQDETIAPSNVSFDQNLRSQNPTWGVRDLQTVLDTAQQQELTLVKTVAMPANNLSVVLVKS